MKLKTAEEFRKEGIQIATGYRTEFRTEEWFELISDVLVTILAHLECAEGKDNEACCHN